MALPERIDDWHKVESLSDFVAYLKVLEHDLQRDEKRVALETAKGYSWVEGQWRHPYLDGYFEQFGAWLSGRFLTPEEDEQVDAWAGRIAAAHADPDAPDPPFDAAEVDAHEMDWADEEARVRALDFRTLAWLMSACRGYE